METVATIHPALVAVRKTPEYAELLAEFQLAASQVYGGEGWAMRRRTAQGAILHLEREAVDNWGVGQSYRATCTACDKWTVPLAYAAAVAWTVKHTDRCAVASTEVLVCGEDGRVSGAA